MAKVKGSKEAGGWKRQVIKRALTKLDRAFGLEDKAFEMLEALLEEEDEE